MKFFVVRLGGVVLFGSHVRGGAPREDFTIVCALINQFSENRNRVLMLIHFHVNGGFLELEIVRAGTIDGAVDVFHRRFKIALISECVGDQRNQVGLFQRVGLLDG